MDEIKRQYLFKEMCNKIDNILQVGDEFIVENLFTPKEWGNLDTSDRRSIGKLFAKKVKDKEINNVKLINPNQKGKNKYKKTK